MRDKQKANGTGMKVQDVQFSAFSPESLTQIEQNQLDLVSDVPVRVSVQLGKAKIAVRDLLGLRAGSVLVVDKMAGEPVEIFVNNKQIAIGEILVMDDNFGVRITDIISQRDLMNKLK
jgi:flagellar motor switch protein FliN/FliY